MISIVSNFYFCCCSPPQVYMACQSMLMVLVGFTPQYRVEQQEAVPSDQLALSPRVVFAEDVDSIVTEVRKG